MPSRDVSQGKAAVYIGKNALAPISPIINEFHNSPLASMPVSAAVEDPESVFQAVDIGRFTGREWLVAEVDKFIAANTDGYIFIEADVGLGKTAFAAWLVKTRGYLSHFSRYPAGRTVEAALANLSAQMISRYLLDELDDWAPGGMLPEWAKGPRGFSKILAAGANRARDRGEPIVLVATDSTRPTSTRALRGACQGTCPTAYM